MLTAAESDVLELHEKSAQPHCSTAESQALQPSIPATRPALTPLAMQPAVNAALNQTVQSGNNTGMDGVFKMLKLRSQRLHQLWQHYGRNICGQGVALLGLLLCTQLLLSWVSIGWQLQQSWRPLAQIMQWTVTLPASPSLDPSPMETITARISAAEKQLKDTPIAADLNDIDTVEDNLAAAGAEKTWPPPDALPFETPKRRQTTALSRPPVLLSERTAWLNMLTETMPITGNIVLASQPWLLAPTDIRQTSSHEQALPQHTPHQLSTVEARLLPLVRIKPKNNGRVVSSIMIDPALMELIKGDNVSSKSVVAEPPLPPPPLVYYPQRLPVQYVSQGYFTLFHTTLWGEPPRHYDVVVNITAAQQLGCKIAAACVGRFIRVANHLMPNVFAGQQLRIGGVVHDLPHFGVFQPKQPMLYADVRLAPPWQTMYVLATSNQQAVVEMRLDKLLAGHWRFMQQQRFDVQPTDMGGFYLPLVGQPAFNSMLPLPELEVKPWPLLRSLATLLSTQWLTFAWVLAVVLLSILWFGLLRRWWQLLRDWQLQRLAQAPVLALLAAFDDKYRPVLAVKVVQPTRTRIRKRNSTKPPPAAPRHFAAIMLWLLRRHALVTLLLYWPCMALVAAIFTQLAPQMLWLSHHVLAVHLQQLNLVTPLLLLLAALALLLPCGIALRLTLRQMREVQWPAPTVEPKLSKTKLASSKTRAADKVANPVARAAGYSAGTTSPSPAASDRYRFDADLNHRSALVARQRRLSSVQSQLDDDEPLFKRRVKKVVEPVSPYQILAPQAGWERRFVACNLWLAQFSLRQLCSYRQLIPEPRKT